MLCPHHSETQFKEIVFRHLFKIGYKHSCKQKKGAAQMHTIKETDRDPFVMCFVQNKQNPGEGDILQHPWELDLGFSGKIEHGI